MEFDAAAGLQINPTESNAEMATITAFDNVTAVETDRYTGNPYFVSNNVAYNWDPDGARAAQLALGLEGRSVPEIREPRRVQDQGRLRRDAM